jgi:hypothetical protein
VRRSPSPRSAGAAERVAVFTTSSPSDHWPCSERMLAACERIRYPHTPISSTTLVMRATARSRAARTVWLRAVGHAGRQSRKINRALGVMAKIDPRPDPDHIPFPEFLDGFLATSSSGLASSGCRRPTTTRADRSRPGARPSKRTFGWTGAHGPLWPRCRRRDWCQLRFRRSALASIGGHGIRLAED